MQNAAKLRVVIVGASPDVTDGLVSTLKRCGYNVKLRRECDSREYELSLGLHAFDLALWCEDGADFSLTRAMQIQSERGQIFPLIVLRNQLTECDRVQALRDGACDAVLLSNSDHFALVVNRELTALSNYRKQVDLERRYMESQRSCFELVQSSKNAVAFVSGGRLVHANPSYRQMFGYSYMTELKGLPLDEVVVGADSDRLDTFIQRLERSGGSGEIELMAVWSGGAQFRVNFNFSVPASMAVMAIGSLRKHFIRDTKSLRFRQTVLMP